MKRFSYALAICFLFTSCAQSAQPLTVHMQATANHQECDETVSPDGSIMDFYPNRASAHEVLFHAATGSTLDASCMESGCRQMLLRISGSKLIPDGAYQFLQTIDDPHVIIVRDGEGARTLGYFVQNNGGGAFKLFPNLQEAEAFEHQGDAARTAGKVAGEVVVGTLLVAAIGALVVGAAAVDAQANSTTTSCSTRGNNTTCTTY
jgi:hypothetical protein